VRAARESVRPEARTTSASLAALASHASRLPHPSCSFLGRCEHSVGFGSSSYGQPEPHNPARHRPLQELVILDKLVTCRLRRAPVVQHGSQRENHPRQHPDGQPVRLKARRRCHGGPAREQRQPQAEDAQEARRGSSAQQGRRGPDPAAPAHCVGDGLC
jgi:hypothetical protein